eukprot:9274115-Ditylum_brightwellii.AAC.1
MLAYNNNNKTTTRECDNNNNINNNNANIVSPENKKLHQYYPVVAPFTNKEVSQVNSSVHPFDAPPLAATSLGAFLAQYGNAAKEGPFVGSFDS